MKHTKKMFKITVFLERILSIHVCSECLTQESEEIKSNSLDHKLKVTETEMMQQKQEKQDQDEVHLTLSTLSTLQASLV